MATTLRETSWQEDRVAQPREEVHPPLGICLKQTGAASYKLTQSLRWRVFARFLRFLRPSLRRPLPDFFVPITWKSPKSDVVCE